MLFDNLTALFCPPTPTPIRQAFISAGGQIATERSVLESKPIDVYVAVWGQEDPLVARLRAIPGVEIVDQSWVSESMAAGELLCREDYSFSQLKERESTKLFALPAKVTLARSPTKSSTPSPRLAMERSAAPSPPATTPPLPSGFLQPSLNDRLSPSPVPRTTTSSSHGDDEEEDANVAAYLLPTSKSVKSPHRHPSSAIPSHPDSPVQIKQESVSAEPHETASPLTTPQSPSSDPSSLQSRLSDASVLLLLYSHTDATSGVTSVPANEILNLLRPPAPPSSSSSSAVEDVRSGLSAMHHGLGGFSVSKHGPS